jgi:hypothetical protein
MSYAHEFVTAELLAAGQQRTSRSMIFRRSGAARRRAAVMAYPIEIVIIRFLIPSTEIFVKATIWLAEDAWNGDKISKKT